MRPATYKKILMIPVLMITLLNWLVSAQEQTARLGLYVGTEAGREILSSIQAKNRFYGFITSPFGARQSRQFGRVCWELNSPLITPYEVDPSDTALRSIISILNENGVKVELVFDITQFIMQDSESALAYVDSLLNFNNVSADLYQSADSIRISFEPEILLESVEDPEDIPARYGLVWEKYVGLLKDIREKIGRSNAGSKYPVKLTISIPSGYDTDRFEFTDYKPLMDLADSIAIYPRSKILRDIKSNCEEEIRYASGKGLPISIAVYAKTYNPLPEASFYTSPLNYMTAVLFTGLNSMDESLPDEPSLWQTYSQTESFAGIDIDGYEVSGSIADLAQSAQPPAGSGPAETSLDYNHDGTQDDSYKPYYHVYAENNIGFYIDLSDPSGFYTVFYDNDSWDYSFATSDGFTLSNDKNGKLSPLEKGKVRVSVNVNKLPDELKQNISSGALKLQIAPDPENTIIPSNPVAVIADQTQNVEFTAGKIDKRHLSTPLKINLFNEDSGKSVQIVSMEVQSPSKNFVINLDDKPLAHFTGAENYQHTVGAIKVLSSHNPQMILKGWAFDDSIVSVKLYIKEKNASQYASAPVVVERYPHPVNSEIPYFGADYESGFSARWVPAISQRGLYEIYLEISDSEHTLEMPKQEIFINTAPECAITAPVSNIDIYDYTFDVSFFAKDLDVNTGIGGELSSACVCLADSQGTVVQQSIIPAGNLIDDSKTVTLANNFYDGYYYIYVDAMDTFGLLTRSTPLKVRIYPPVKPEILRIEPRIGTFKGNNYVEILGNNIKYVNSVSFGDNFIPFQIDAPNSVIRVFMPEFSESRYLDIKIGNYAGFDIDEDAYRVIPGRLTYLNDFSVKCLKYNNIYNKLYALGLNKNQLKIYRKDADTVNLSELKTVTPANGTGKGIEVSKYGQDMYLSYENSNIIDIYDNNGTHINTAVLSDNDGNAVYPESMAYMFNGKLLIGTSGTGADLYMYDIDAGFVFCYKLAGLCSEPHVEFDEVKVYPYANMAGAYIVCEKFAGEPLVKVFRYDGKTESVLPVDISLPAGNCGSFRIAVNHNGNRWMVYSDTSCAVFDSADKRVTGSNTGFDIALFDMRRDIIYAFKTDENRFSIYSQHNLSEKIADCGLPFWFKFQTVPEIDWDGEYLYAAGSNWIAAVKPGDIYPRISVSPQFVQRQTVVEINAGNAGKTAENLAVYLNSDKNPVTASLNSADNGSYSLSILAPDCDSSDKVYVKAKGYPSEKKDIINKSRLIDYLSIAQRAGLNTFSPTALFFDTQKSDLYTFDRLKTGNLSILRFHIDFDNESPTDISRLTIPPKMQVSVPLGICKVNNYLIALSMTDKKCYWFDVEVWDSTGDATVYSSVKFPFTPSGIAGYHGADKNYVYIWNSLCTSMGQSVFQLDLNTGLIKACSKLAVFCPAEIYIDPISGFGYVSSSTGFDYISRFDASLSAADITELNRLPFAQRSSVYRIFADSDFMYASLLGAKEIAVFGFEPDYIESIIRHNLTAYYFSADGEYLVFGGKNNYNTYRLNIHDSNRWNDYPPDMPFNLLYYFDSNSYILDIKLINNKLFAISDKDIIIIDLPDKKED